MNNLLSLCFARTQPKIKNFFFSDGNKEEVILPDANSTAAIRGYIFVDNTESNKQKLAQMPEIKYVITLCRKELEITCYGDEHMAVFDKTVIFAESSVFYLVQQVNF